MLPLSPCCTPLRLTEPANHMPQLMDRGKSGPNFHMYYYLLVGKWSLAKYASTHTHTLSGRRHGSVVLVECLVGRETQSGDGNIESGGKPLVANRCGPV